MFTVVIAEKEHIDSIQEYKVFLKPFIDDACVEFCEWRPEEATLADSVPHLVDAVSHHREWRAIVLCDENGLEKKNPFERVDFLAPSYIPLTETEDEELLLEHRQRYLNELKEKKFRAFEQAAKQPLTQLMARLCEGPLLTKNKNSRVAEFMAPIDRLDYMEYQEESQKKQELREQIIAGEKLNISLPAEVVCVAKRTHTQQEYDISTSWEPHEDIQYSRFYDWNLYFDKMRYLVFDILPKGHQDYEFDYIRFLYAVMILANNDTPSGVLRPNRVFRMNCENDEEALVYLLSLYDTKLAQTDCALAGKVTEIRNAEKPRLSDRDAKMIFCSNINVPVTLSKEIDRGDLFVDPGALGLATDCPKDEYGEWDRAYLKSRKTLYRLFKQPRRAVKSAAADMRRMNHVDLDRAGFLNEFQMEDVKDYTGEEELNMVSVETPDLYDVEHYEKQMTEHCKKVHRKIETRMARKTTIALGLAVLVLYLVGFLPLLFNNRADVEKIVWALTIMGAGVALLAVVCLICLLFLRGSLRELYRAFNRVMQGISNEIDGSLAQFSRYLSHACNVMRGFSVINFREHHEDPEVMRIRVYEKHLADIKRTREELREIFGSYVPERAVVDSEKVDIYPYDFDRPVDFAYPIPYSDGMKCQIEFMQPGNTVQVPVNFVKRIAVRREELYD